VADHTLPYENRLGILIARNRNVRSSSPGRQRLHKKTRW
jgi:hypothetical protein